MISKSHSRLLARKLWTETQGPIPHGMQLHHRDGNALNNELTNLEVCTPEEHIAFHKALGHKIQRNFIAKADFYASFTPEQKFKFREASAASGRLLKGIPKSQAHKAKLREIASAHPVEMIDLKTGKIVNEFPSVIEASRVLNMQRGHVLRVIRGLRKSWRGHVFRYKG